MSQKEKGKFSSNIAHGRHDFSKLIHLLPCESAASMQCLPKLQMVQLICSPHLKEGYAKGSGGQCPKSMRFIL